jgi:hypothetical protein
MGTIIPKIERLQDNRLGELIINLSEVLKKYNKR